MVMKSKALEILENNNLNWSVKKEKLVTNDGKITDSFGMFRSDTNDWLGTVGPQYVPLQNIEMLDFVLDISEQLELPIDKGGHFKDGRKVFIQLKLDTQHIGTSDVHRWLTITNSHDGSSSITIGYSNKVVNCDNQFHRLGQQGNKIRHTISAETKVNEKVDQVKDYLIEEGNLIQYFDRMQASDLKDEALEKTLWSLFEINKNTKQSEVSTKKKNQIIKLSEAVNDEVNAHGKTLWALFNGVTRYTNHVASPNNEDQKESYLRNGGGYKLNNKAFNTILPFLMI